MGFLNNSGDIILDAVLTDTGRMKLARGDGSFKISKFALADDEIDYGLYVSNTGSAYTDLQILQTPVLEAFTNNASSMKSKLVSINLKNLLYLPTVKVNNKNNRDYTNKMIVNGYLVAVDSATETYLTATTTTFASARLTGVLRGFTTAGSPIIRVDQGLDTNAVNVLPPELKETQYIIEIDNRFGTITDSNNKAISPSYIDDDDIASYFVSLGTDPSMVSDNPNSFLNTSNSSTGEVINGPRGTMLHFGIEASTSTKASTYFFDSLGRLYTGTRSPSTGTLRYIPSQVTITGATTGYSVVIPIAFVKYTT
jgi:hypothetical protein